MLMKLGLLQNSGQVRRSGPAQLQWPGFCRFLHREDFLLEEEILVCITVTAENLFYCSTALCE
jgi:hypothetical protein